MDNIFQNLPNDIIMKIIKEADGGRATHKIKFKKCLDHLMYAHTEATRVLDQHLKYQTKTSIAAYHILRDELRGDMDDDRQRELIDCLPVMTRAEYLARWKTQLKYSIWWYPILLEH
tara:strand:- start:1862 stop:2212 length:351 start_codon:yes stop_codon:yes gene_type:complete